MRRQTTSQKKKKKVAKDIFDKELLYKKTTKNS